MRIFAEEISYIHAQSMSNLIILPNTSMSTMFISLVYCAAVGGCTMP